LKSPTLAMRLGLDDQCDGRARAKRLTGLTRRTAICYAYDYCV
jgi:hypothetical protein